MKLEKRPVVRVDDVLLALCNEAYASAEARSASDVLVADLVWCAARSPYWPRDFDDASGAADRLVHAAGAIISRSERRLAGRPMRTSGDLKTLLLRAERLALDGGREAAGIRDLADVLFRRSADLAGAGFVRKRARAGFHDAIDGRAPYPQSAWGSRARDTTGYRQSGGDPGTRAAFRPSAGFAESPRGRQAPPSFGGQRDWPAHGGTTASRGAATEDTERRLQSKMDSFTCDLEGVSERLQDVANRMHSVERDHGRHDAHLEKRLSEIGAGGIAVRSEVGELARRVALQDRQISELKGLVDALSQQAMTAAARLSQAIESNRAQTEQIASLERTLARGESTDSRRQGRGRRQGAARRRARRLRRSLGLRLRRRRARTRTERRSGRHRSLRSWARASAHDASRASRDVLSHVAPPATFGAGSVDGFDAVPRPYLDNLPPQPAPALEASTDYEDETTEPIEDDDPAELESALGDRPKRFYLALDDEVERAPSIGPRTAERLTRAGVATVRDLLACDPRQIAARVQSRYVSAERLDAWKCQSRLVCTVPWLRGTHAQLLVGAGFETLEKLQDAATSDVCSGILRFASTRDGQSVLRSGEPPAPERVAKWMGNVTLAEPERASLAA